GHHGPRNSDADRHIDIDVGRLDLMGRERLRDLAALGFRDVDLAGLAGRTRGTAAVLAGGTLLGLVAALGLIGLLLHAARARLLGRAGLGFVLHLAGRAARR